MKTLPIPPGTYRLDSPEVRKLLNVTPDQQQKMRENLKRAAIAATRKQLYQYVFDGMGI